MLKCQQNHLPKPFHHERTLRFCSGPRERDLRSASTGERPKTRKRYLIFSRPSEQSVDPACGARKASLETQSQQRTIRQFKSATICVHPRLGEALRAKTAASPHPQQYGFRSALRRSQGREHCRTAQPILRAVHLVFIVSGHSAFICVP